MRITILYFAHLAERAGTREETRELPEGATAGDVRSLIEQAHPKLNGMLGGVRIAVDEEFARDDTKLREGQTIALIPPVSGG